MNQVSAIALAALMGAVVPMRAASLSDADRARCFSDNAGEETVTFIFDNNLWKISTPSKVEVRGSFNGWSSSSKWQMAYDDEADAWLLTVAYEDVKVPGNSGQPEFKFVTNGSNYLSGSSKSFIPEGYVFMNGDRNNIVVFDSDDFGTIKENSATANRLKSLSDFDLTTREGREEISNFRKVPGTRALFRSYHPYKITKNTNPTEPVRMAELTALAQEEGIKSDICLSENEERNLQSFTIAGERYQEAIPEYYQDIIDAGRVLYVGTVNKSTPSYNEVYYNSTGTKLGVWVKEIVDFINSDDSEAPYLIHCRLGTDRTGVFCGILAALCGAEWEEIAADYQKSNRMGTQEFRDYHLLQYSFMKMLGVTDISQAGSVAEGIRNYFLSNGILDADDIRNLREKIGESLSGISETAPAMLPSETVYHSLDGRTFLSCPSVPGIYIRTVISSAGSLATKIAVR